MRSNGRNFRWLYTAIRIAAVLSFAVILASLQAYCPLRTLLPAYAVPARGEGELRLHFLNVGQGDCTVVEFPDGDVLMIDAGGGDWNCRTKLIRYIKALAPASLTLLVTHADLDHFGGFEEILRTFHTERLYLPVADSQNTAYRTLLKTAETHDCPMQVLSRYGVIAHSSGAYLNCISPYAQGEENENDASAVLWLSYEGINALFCGDITASREERLMTEYSFDETLFDFGNYTVRLPETDILKVAHHGSKTSSSRQWINFLHAETAVISCGQGNVYSHPAEETLATLAAADCAVYRIDELGDIIITIKNGSYSVQTILE